MAINLDTLRTLDAGKSYYIANSTGQIKVAGAWQKFKVFVGIGDGRDKVQRLIDQVKVALLTASAESENAELSQDIQEYSDNHNWSFSASGRSIAAIANRFAVANADKIASASAKHIAEGQIKTLIRDTVRPCLRRQDWPADAVAYLERAATPLVEHPPMKDAAGGRRVLDEDAFKQQLAKLLDDTSTDLVHVAKDTRLGMPRFDSAFLDHVFATFYDENGVRNGKTEADLRPAADIRLEAAMREAGDPPGTTDAETYAARVRDAVEACGNDTDVIYCVIHYIQRILIDNGGQLRSREAVLKRVSDYRENFAAMREAAKGSPTALRLATSALRGMPGKPLPPGFVGKIAQLARSIDLGDVAKLEPGKGCYNIHRAVNQFSIALMRVFKETGVGVMMDGQDDYLHARQLVAAFLLGRFPPEVLRNFDAALMTPEAARVRQTHLGISSAEIWPDALEDMGDGLRQVVSGQAGTLNNVIDVFKRSVGTMLDLPMTGIDSEKADQVDDEDSDTERIARDIRKTSEALAKAEREEFLATQAVHGEGPAAGRLRQLISANLEEFPYAAGRTMRDRYTSMTRPLHSLAALCDAKEVEKGLIKDTGFARAIANGSLEVRIEGVGELSSDPDIALDQLARHVAGKKDATFATLDAMARRKVAVIVGCLGDKAMNTISYGVGLALAPDGGKPALVLSDESETRRVVLSCPGGEQLDMKIDIELTGTGASMGSESFALGHGSAVKIRYNFEIGRDGMRKFEKKVNLDAFDGTAAGKVASNLENVPGRAERVKELVGKDYMIGSGVDDVSAEFTIN